MRNRENERLPRTSATGDNGVAIGAGVGMIVGAAFDAAGPGMVLGAALGKIVGAFVTGND